ncbi:MAG: hypothetical protein AAF548_16270 [Actinomycetota bacterium]
MTEAEAREIVMIAVPRSGTNFLCECIADFPSVLGLFEIFNPRGVFGAKNAGLLTALNDILGTRYAEVSEPELVARFRDDPLEAATKVRAAAAARGFAHVSYKIFPGQVDDENLVRLLSDRSRTVLFLARRRLDTYISYVKARELDVWKSESTEALLPHIDATEFMKWSKRTEAWYARAKEIVDEAGTPHRVLSYEDDVSLPKDAVVAGLSMTFSDLGLDVGAANAAGVRFRRQDRQVGPFKKIANGDELRAELRGRKKYNYALARPLEDD